MLARFRLPNPVIMEGKGSLFTRQFQPIDLVCDVRMVTVQDSGGFRKAFWEGQSKICKNSFSFSRSINPLLLSSRVVI